ncbi:MAG TPA: hypothetical protein VGB77_15715 [Abditibacteriaceae bacterium]|jgi:hypothetical protein
MIDFPNGNTLSMRDFQKSISAAYAPRFGADVAAGMAEAFMEDALSKGLASTGTQAIAGVTTGGDATTMEALYDEVVSTELNMKDHATIWNDLQKIPVFEEFLQKVDMNSYGGFRRGGFINPNVASGGVTSRIPNLKRQGIPVRWVGGRFQTFTNLNSQRTLGLNVDPAVGNAGELNSEARLQQMILNANELCLHGDNDINSLEPYGILQQIRAHYTKGKPTRIDMKGQPITRDFVPTLRTALRLAGGNWSHFYGAPTMYNDLELSMLGDIRRTDGQAVTLGMYPEEALIRDLGGKKGTSLLREDQFLETLGDEPTVSDDGAPTRPTTVTAAAAANAAGTNFWGSNLAAGVYFYSVAAVGINGRSAVRALTGSVTVSAGDAVTLTITNADAGTVFFEIYRGTTATNRQYLSRVTAEGVAAAGATTFKDDGEWRPGCSTAIAMTIRPMKKAQSIHIAQLLPTTKVELPPELMASEGGWICGFTPRVMNEVHQVVIENIGRYTG